MLKHLNNLLDIKQVSEDGEFEGYASIFGVVDRGMDVVEKGAFRRSLAERPAGKVKLLYQHDSDKPIGVWKEIREDDRGLFVKGQLLEKVQKGAEVLELLRAGAIDGLSIGYQTIKSSRDETTGVRRLLDVDLWEISVVTFPMNMQSTIDAVKNELTKRDVEHILRDAGVPNEFAKMVAIYGVDEAKSRLSGGHREGDKGLIDVVASLKRATTIMKG
jgi:uncharacterized protein